MGIEKKTVRQCGYAIRPMSDAPRVGSKIFGCWSGEG
jgi:hypothetical protein